MKNSKMFSKTSLLHLFKFIYRTSLFVVMTILYLYNLINNTGSYFGNGIILKIFAWIVWALFMFEIIKRFFPSKVESPGCQKHLFQTFIPTRESEPIKQSMLRPLLVAILWIIGNGLIGLLYFLEIIDAGILVLLCLLYGICDMVCILFFCPFQTWFIKNRCCSDCRIYNWDFAMMFTPFVFIPHFYTYSLLGASLVLLVTWEVAYYLHPERFSVNTNGALSCERCNEKLCFHKKQLQHFIQKNKNRFFFRKD